MAKETHHELGDGDSAVYKTLREMMCRLARRDAADNRIKSLVASLRRRTETETVKAIFYHVVKTIRYVSDPENIEYVAAPIYTLGLAKPALYRGDCDDMVTALAALLGAAGIRCKMRVIDWKPGVNAYTHVDAVAILSDGTEIPLDPVMGYGGWYNHKTAGVRRQFFYECIMKGITLEDRLSGNYPIEGLAGCSCGGKCNGRCGRKRNSCCPMNSGSMSPVNVNVITSAGGQDFSSSRALYANDARTLTIPTGTNYARESTKYVQQSYSQAPIANLRPAPSVNYGIKPFASSRAESFPPSQLPVARVAEIPQEKKIYKEFY